MTPHSLHRHYVCLCTDDADLDITIETETESPEAAIAQVITALLEREAST